MKKQAFEKKGLTGTYEAPNKHDVLLIFCFREQEL